MNWSLVCKIIIIFLSLMVVIMYTFSEQFREFHSQVIGIISPKSVSYNNNVTLDKKRAPNISYSHVSNNNNVTLDKMRAPKRILMYTTYFHVKHWWGDARHPQYNIQACEVNNCVVTHDKTDYKRSDAVMFHARDLPRKRKALRVLRRSSEKQIWIWLVMESPINLKHNRFDDDELFNWTATYRTESDIFIPYFNIKNLTENEAKPKLEHNFAEGKDKMLIVIMSNCVKKRIDLLKQMNNYVKVDLYGNCSEKLNPEFKEKCPFSTKECEDLQSRYKFYFVIENSFCKDYVTEKFYRNALMKGLVPIVVGGGNFKDSRVAPPNSYINLLDFKDLRSLGDHLNYLDKNDTAYNEYHQWRYSQKIDWRQSICNVCKQLWEYDNKNDIAASKKTAELKISDFWDADRQCKSLGDVLEKYLN